MESVFFRIIKADRMKKIKTLKFEIFALSLTVTILVAIMSRVFLPGLITWRETIITLLPALLICHFSTVVFEQKKKMVVIRNVLLGVLAGSFIFFYIQTNDLVYRIADYKLNKDSTFIKTSRLVIAGKQLNPEYEDEISGSLNRRRDIEGIIKYFGVEPSEIWIDYKESRSRIVFSYALLMVSLIALSTHLAEEVFLNVKQTKSADVFISFNHKDISFANIVSECLKNKKIRVKLYSEDTEMGSDIEKSIRKWIKNTSITLALISKNSLLSNWVGKEIYISLILEEYTDNRKFLACKVEAIEFNSELTKELMDCMKNSPIHQNSHLIHQIGDIIEKLRISVYCDLSQSPFNQELEKLVSAIKIYLGRN